MENRKQNSEVGIANQIVSISALSETPVVANELSSKAEAASHSDFCFPSSAPEVGPPGLLGPGREVRRDALPTAEFSQS